MEAVRSQRATGGQGRCASTPLPLRRARSSGRWCWSSFASISASMLAGRTAPLSLAVRETWTDGADRLERTDYPGRGKLGTDSCARRIGLGLFVEQDVLADIEPGHTPGLDAAFRRALPLLSRTAQPLGRPQGVHRAGARIPVKDRRRDHQPSVAIPSTPSLARSASRPDCVATPTTRRTPVLVGASNLVCVVGLAPS